MTNASKKHKPVEISGKLCEVEIVLTQRASTAAVFRRTAISERADYRCARYGSLKTDQAGRMIRRRRTSGYAGNPERMLDKLVLQEAARNFGVQRGGGAGLIMCDASSNSWHMDAKYAGASQHR